MTLPSSSMLASSGVMRVIESPFEMRRNNHRPESDDGGEVGEMHLAEHSMCPCGRKNSRIEKI